MVEDKSRNNVRPDSKRNNRRDYVLKETSDKWRRIADKFKSELEEALKENRELKRRLNGK